MNKINLPHLYVYLNFRKKDNLYNNIVERLRLFSQINNYTFKYITDQNNDEILSVYKFNQTIDTLKKNIDIIIRPVLHEEKKKICGIADIIIKKNVI